MPTDLTSFERAVSTRLAISPNELRGFQIREDEIAGINELVDCVLGVVLRWYASKSRKQIAGLEPWPKLFQNLRSTRPTELEESFPSHVVCKWMGNSRAVAAKHYLQVTDEHFSKAVQNPVQYALVGSCMTQDASHTTTEIPDEYYLLRNHILEGVAEAGLEPARP